MKINYITCNTFCDLFFSAMKVMGKNDSITNKKTKYKYIYIYIYVSIPIPIQFCCVKPKHVAHSRYVTQYLKSSHKPSNRANGGWREGKGEGMISLNNVLWIALGIIVI